MSNKNLSNPKGTRDFPPEEKILRDKVINQIKEIFERYGYSPLETPTFEKIEILDVKNGAGETSDIVSEIYRFKDQGGRELGLRYEFTFALARFFGQNPQLKLPFKRYQIGPVFRDGPIKSGRYREFYQCDIDVIGVNQSLVDAEVLSVVKDVFNKLDLEVVIEINNRKLLNEIITFCGISEEQTKNIIITIDKLKKIGVEGVKKELLEKTITEEQTNKLLSILEDIQKGNNQQKIEALEKKLGNTQGLQELKSFFENLKMFKVNFEFNPTLARGLGYYTSLIFEVFLKDETIMSGSIAGGGRWDDMIGKYIGNNNLNMPATGLAFGIEPILENIKKRDGLPKKTVANLLIVPIGETLEKTIEITQKLRNQGKKIIVDLQRKNISKNLEYANKLGIPFVGIIGEDEVKQNKIKIKNMSTGEEELLDIDKINI